MTSRALGDIWRNSEYSCDESDDEEVDLINTSFRNSDPPDNPQSTGTPHSDPPDNPQSTGTPHSTPALAVGRPITEQDAFDGQTLYEDESIAVVALAQQNYETFYNLKPGTVTTIMLEHTSAGIAGWASCTLNASPSKEESEQDDANKKRKTPTTESKTAARRRRKCDDDEARELQLALLESLGVDVGYDAKRSLLHDADFDGNNVDDESGSEGDWSIEDDGLEEKMESVCLQSDRSDEGGRKSPLMEGVRVRSEADSGGTASSFVVVHSTGDGDSTDTNTSNEEDGIGETGLSPLTSGLRIDSSEGDSQDSAESFVDVTAPTNGDDSSSSNDWALL